MKETWVPMVGAAFCYIRREYASRINCILRSWNVVQKSAMEAGGAGGLP